MMIVCVKKMNGLRSMHRLGMGPKLGARTECHTEIELCRVEIGWYNPFYKSFWRGVGQPFLKKVPHNTLIRVKPTPLNSN